MMHPYFHFAVLVEDLAVAIDDFSQAFGVGFTPIATVHVRFEEPEPTEYDLSYVYSTPAPPYIELIEGQGDGLFSLAGGGGLHHVGVFDDGFEGSLERARASGVCEATQLTASGETYWWFSSPRSLHGIRTEHIHPYRRAGFEAWVSGGQHTLPP
jgi:hypothetical protein